MIPKHLIYPVVKKKENLSNSKALLLPVIKFQGGFVPIKLWCFTVRGIGLALDRRPDLLRATLVRELGLQMLPFHCGWGANTWWRVEVVSFLKLDMAIRFSSEVGEKKAVLF